VTAPNPEVTADQVASFPAAAGQAVRELVEEYEARESLEARLAKDADKLECLIQASSPSLSAGAAAPVVEGLHGAVSEADQDERGVGAAGPRSVRRFSTRRFRAGKSTQELT
jgi:hypothetical protein